MMLDPVEAAEEYAEALESAKALMPGNTIDSPDYWLGRLHGLIFQHESHVPTADLLDVFIPLAEAMDTQKKTDAPAPIQYTPGTYPGISTTFHDRPLRVTS